MDEYTGSVKELRGLFKISKTNIQTGSLHQQICNTAQKQFGETNGDCSLFGLDFTKDEHITNWIHRANGTYKKVQFPKTLEGMLSVNSMKKSFNFLKSLDIAAINNEIELLHPSTHEFWEDEETRTKFFLFDSLFQKTFAAQDDTESIKLQNDEGEIEVGFVDGLFEMYKLWVDIAKARAELMAEGALSSYN